MEYATLEWIDWFNNLRLIESIGHVPPAQYERDYHRLNEAQAMAAWLNHRSLRTSRGGSLSITGYLMKRFGVSVTMALLPLTILLGFIGLAIVGSLVMVVILDATSKAVQRAIMRPARETLFTVLNRAEKYKAKAFIDTFVYRGGDVIGAQVEGLLKSLGFGLIALTGLVIPMSIGWTFLGIWLGRRQIAKATEQGIAGNASPPHRALATIPAPE